MKKIMFALVAVLVGLTVNAAAVAWSSGTFAEGFGSPDNKKMSGSAFTITVSVFADAAGATLVDTSSSSAPGSKNGAYTGSSANVLGASTTYYLQATITDGTQSRTLDMVSFTTPPTGNINVNFQDGSGLASVNGGGTTWATSAAGAWGGNADTPEPTSGLLLLVGGAMLALRRKRS